MDKAILCQVLNSMGHTAVPFSKDTINAKDFDIAFHLELVYAGWLANSKVKNVFYPNPEWFMSNWKPYLNRFHLIACKTYDTQQIFEKLKLKTLYTSFTSHDRYIEKAPKLKSFVHLQGRSIAKGTDQVVEAFTYPDMPQLCIHTQRDLKREIHYPFTDNIKLFTKKYNDSEYKLLQNRHRVHLCTSIYEGFGHYINEALSCKAVVITTNGEPMMEVAGPNSFGCSVVFAEPWNLAVKKIPAVTSLIDIVKTVNELPEDVLIQMGERNRKLFLDRHEEFLTNIDKLIKLLMK